MAKGINWLGRGLGVVSAALLASAWAFVLWVPAAGLTVTGISVVTALLLVALAVFAGIAAAHGHAVVLALLFLASFFPVGAFLIPTDHWLKWVGWIDLGLLAAAVLIRATARRVAAP
jgi:ABC-type glycerol-3-phosphate transport system permease component